MGAAPISSQRSIAVILPPREGFSPSAFGAVSLSVRDFTYASDHAEQIHVYGGPCDYPFAGIAFHPVALDTPWYVRKRARYLRGLRRLLGEQKPALIEVHNRPSIAAAIARWGIAPVSLFLHNDPHDMRGCQHPQARRRLSARLAGIICVSDYIRQRWCDGIGQLPHVHSCPLGLAMPEQRMAKKNQILFVGRMVPEKGVHVYAEALLQCLPQHPQWKGIFVGGKRFAKEALSDYEQHILNDVTPIKHQVEWRGFQNHDATMQAFAESAIAVIPSLWEEPFGRIAIEAMSHGCAVATSASGGLAEIVGDAALIAQPCTAAALAAHLDMLMRQPETRAAYQQRAKKRAAMFDIHDTARHLDTVRSQITDH
jgi:glycosyltransferase involved in cell wall biosynthesis